jgi:hypothetical protein
MLSKAIRPFQLADITDGLRFPKKPRNLRPKTHVEPDMAAFLIIQASARQTVGYL